MSLNIIPCKCILSVEDKKNINAATMNKPTIQHAVKFLSTNYNIAITADQDIVKSFERDYSNLPGNAEALCRPENELECSQILSYCYNAQIPITIAAGRTNLNGSATPLGGLVLSMEKMTHPKPQLNIKTKCISSPVGIYLESMRNAALQQSNKKLYFPVDPTSRKEAMVGGAISCNASGFVPGKTGAMRYWTEALDFLTPDGHKITCKRGQFISKNGVFFLNSLEKTIKWNLPTYPRPSIKNASGPYSDENGRIDLIDLLVGSEGIFGLITQATFRLKEAPDEYLDLFFSLPCENDAIKFHTYIFDYFNGDLSQITALEYFGYNCQNYMDNKKVLFQSETDVGIYLQIPLYEQKVEDVAENWLNILQLSKCGITENNILILNNPQDWNTFFNARHSIPVNALKKTHNLDTWSILTDTIVPPNNFRTFQQEVHELLQNSKIEYLLFGHLGDCHLHFHFIPKKSQQSKALEIYKNIIKISADLGGIYSAEHGTGKRKRSDFVECFGNNGVQQVLEAKSNVDPHFLLNRGNIIEV